MVLGRYGGGGGAWVGGVVLWCCGEPVPGAMSPVAGARAAGVTWVSVSVARGGTCAAVSAASGGARAGPTPESTWRGIVARCRSPLRPAAEGRRSACRRAARPVQPVPLPGSWGCSTSVSSTAVLRRGEGLSQSADDRRPRAGRLTRQLRGMSTDQGAHGSMIHLITEWTGSPRSAAATNAKPANFPCLHSLLSDPAASYPPWRWSSWRVMSGTAEAWGRPVPGTVPTARGPTGVVQDLLEQLAPAR